MLEVEDTRISKAAKETLEDHGDLCMEPMAAEASGYGIVQPCIPNEEEEEEDDNKEEGAEENYKAGMSTVSQIGPEEMQNQAFELDNSIFLNEDSNQPLPMDRFFGSVAFTQDLPPVPLSRANVSRREFRKTHFIAKDDDDDEEEVI